MRPLKQLSGLNDGFTLIELLVVIGIISILATLMLPGLIKGNTEARKTRCRENLRGLYSALITYELTYGSYPNAKGMPFFETLRNFPTPETSVIGIRQHDLFVCPFTTAPRQSGSTTYRGPNYEVGGVLTGNEPLCADRVKNHDPKNGREPISVLYAGGKILTVIPNSVEWNEVEDQTCD